MALGGYWVITILDPDNKGCYWTITCEFPNDGGWLKFGVFCIFDRWIFIGSTWTVLYVL